MTQTLEEAVLETLGEDGLKRLVARFYAGVARDSLLRPMYPEADLGPAEARLFDFLLFRFGGSQRYLDERGHPRLRMRHAPYAIDQQARDAWMKHMTEALEQTVEDGDLRNRLREFLGQVADFLRNQPG
jgi:hemoglobin